MTLSFMGYRSYSEVNKILVVQYIQELFNSIFKHYIADEDVRLMNELLYQLIGSTCEISFPTNCKCCNSGGCGGDIPTPTPTPSITNFRMEPNKTKYTGTQSVVFTGASFNISAIDYTVAGSMQLLQDNVVIKSGLSFSENSTTFSPDLTLSLSAGKNYTFKLSVQGKDDNTYYSDSYVITVEEDVKPVPSITNFKLIPNQTTYTGSQTLIFTGASFTVANAGQLKAGSMSLLQNGVSILDNIDFSSNTATFSPNVKVRVEAGKSYTFKVSAEGIDGKTYYSNNFVITVKQEVTPDPVETVYMYTGNTADTPTDSEILTGSKYDYKSTKTFTTPKMDLRSIWVCLPKTVTLVSMENTNFSDFLYNLNTGKNLMKTRNVTIDNTAYTLYYLTTIPSKSPYKTIVK